MCRDHIPERGKEDICHEEPSSKRRTGDPGAAHGPDAAVFLGSLSNVGVSSNSSTTHGRERFLLMSVFILISPSKAVKSENGIVQSCENQMLLSLTP